jgi:geranylgeranyl pyrophosphate synthase
MQKRKLKQTYPVIKLLTQLKPEHQKLLFEHLNDNVCSSVVDCVKNGLYNKKVPAKSREFIKEKLSAHKEAIRKIVRPNISRTTRRKRLVQSGGFLGVLLSTVLPILAEVLFNQLKK